MLGKHLGIGLAVIYLYNPGLQIKGTNAVEFGGVGFCWSIAPALLGNHVNQDRASPPPGLAQDALHFRNIVTVDGAQVSKAQLFKEHAADQEIFEAGFNPLHGLVHGAANGGDLAHQVFHIIPDPGTWDRCGPDR